MENPIHSSGRRLVLVTAFVLTVSVAAALLAGVGGAAPRPIVGPFTLTTLPRLGQVVWTCGPRDTTGRDQYGLGFRAFKSSGTQTVTLRLGAGRLRRQTIQPGGRLRMVLSSQLRQELTATLKSKPGILRAAVHVNFAPNGVNGNIHLHCAPYDPPRVDVQSSR